MQPMQARQRDLRLSAAAGMLRHVRIRHSEPFDLHNGS
jgi:hypothetical protein